MAVNVADDTIIDLPFEVNTVRVQLDFGDNGSDNDNTFALFVGGKLIHSMPRPTRNAGPLSVELDEGSQTVDHTNDHRRRPREGYGSVSEGAASAQNPEPAPRSRLGSPDGHHLGLR